MNNKGVQISLGLLCTLTLPWVTLAKDNNKEETTHFESGGFIWDTRFLINYIILLAHTQHTAKYMAKSSPPSLTGKKYGTEFITSSSGLQISTLIQVTLPHSLTSSRGQSEDQFLVKSPAPPLASAPVETLGSWPLPPPPGLCWYGCGFEQLLVGGLEGISKKPLLSWDCSITAPNNYMFWFCVNEVMSLD